MEAKVSSVSLANLSAQLRLDAGYIFDLGLYDLSNDLEHKKCRKYLERRAPLLIGHQYLSSRFASLFSLEGLPNDPEEHGKLWKRYLLHFERCLEIYREQLEWKRHVVHEAPPARRSEEMTALMALKTFDADIKEAPGIFTNLPEVAESLEKSAGSVRYKNFKGLQKYIRDNFNGERLSWCLGALEVGVHVDEESVNFDTVSQEPWAEECFDDISGARLDPKLVKAARAEELEFLHGFGVYKKIAREIEGKGPFLTLKWVDINKG